MRSFNLIILSICLIILFGFMPSVHAGDPQVKIITTKGTIVVELAPAEAPATVENFLRYVQDGFYDNTIFHRVIKGFMIQGGGLTAEMKRKPTNPPVKNEADNGLKNIIGTIAMARTPDPHSATSQFFINAKNNDFLNFSRFQIKNARGLGLLCLRKGNRRFGIC